MNVENKYKEHVLSNLTPKDGFKELSAKLDFKAPKKNIMKKKGIVVLTSCVCACVAIGIGAYVLFGNNTPDNTDSSKLAMVKMNLNPSISFVVSDDGKVQVGNPYVKGVKVEGKVVSHGKGKKIIVFKMKAKKNERTKQGHRQPYTKVEITGIKTAAKKVAKAEEAEKVEA